MCESPDRAKRTYRLPVDLARDLDDEARWQGVAANDLAIRYLRQGLRLDHCKKEKLSG